MPVGSKLLITAALTAANMALTMSRKIEGPRLDSTKFTGGDYGADLGLIWGTRRRNVPIFWAEDLKEVKRRRKTKGGKYNEYSYYGTWAVALAGHEIQNVRRIWFDTHLVFDLSGAGPVTPFSFSDDFFDRLRVIRTAHDLSGVPANGSKTGKFSSLLAIYTGTETQEPDPRIEASVEAEFGEGSCPAYRGTAYVVFKDIPLEKLGNRIPQCSVEMVTSATPNYPYDRPTNGDLPDMVKILSFNNDYSRLYALGTNDYEIWDVASRSLILSGDINPIAATPSLGDKLSFDDDGALYLVNQARYVLKIEPDFTSAVTLYDAGTGSLDSALRVVDGNGNSHLYSSPATTLHPFRFDGADLEMVDLTGEDWQPDHCFVDLYGDVWIVGALGGNTTCHLYRMVNVSGHDVPNHITATMSSAASSEVSVKGRHFQGGAYDHFVIKWEGDYYRVEFDGSVTAFLADPGGAEYGFATAAPDASTFWIETTEVSLADLTVVRTVDDSDWVSATASAIYDPVNHALVAPDPVGGQLIWRYLDRIDGAGVTLGGILADVADMVGIEDRDFSALDQLVTGWSATRGSADNMVEPLLDAYDSDIRPHDFAIQGVKRSGVSGGSIATQNLVGDPRYDVPIKQGAELPRSLTFTFADTAADQQPNNIIAARPLDATGARGEGTIDLGTLALDADTARDLGDRYFRRLWNERREVHTGLTMQQASLEPGDVRTIDLDGNEAIYRLASMVFSADDSIKTEWKYDHPSLAVLNGGTGAPFDGRDPSVVIVPLPSKGFVLDIPLIRDADSSTNPALYMAAGPYAAGAWTGATIYEAVDGEYSEESLSVASSDAATWGYANGVLADANPWLWDRGNSVNVTVQSGDLTGATEAALDANPNLNLCLLGDELLQFASAVLEADGTYTLSGFKRGRRGTEWATATHAARDVFLLMDTAQDVAQGLSEVGTGLSFKAITAGRTDGFATAVSFTGATLKPYAPVDLEAVKEASGDWTFTWVRRTRVGGAWTGGTSIPLSEASEQYHVTVGDGVTSDTKTVTSPTYTWDVATQTADTGGEVMEGDLAWSVAQVSDAVGDGFLATA